MIKKSIVVVALIILFPILIYTAIVITNNCIADGIEKELKGIALPDSTELVDSMSIAAKITGNGNGMQYYGMILVTSDLSKDELKEYYNRHSEHIDVFKQETATVFDDSYLINYTFENFDPSKNNYMIYCFDANTSDWMDNGFFEELLDLDIRGH